MATVSELISVLVIEDEEQVFNLIKDTLSEKPIEWPLKYKLENAKTLSEAKERLSGKFDIVILDLNLPDSKGPKTFYNLKSQVPVIIMTGQSNGIFEQLIRDGARRCYDKSLISSCMPILHHSIRHVLAETKLQKTVIQQSETIIGKLRPTIVACAGCHRWFDEKTCRWMSQTHYLKQNNFIISHSHCSDCEKDFYGDVLREATEDYK